MHQSLLLPRVIHGDDAGVKLRVSSIPNTQRAHLRVGIGDADSP
jgi:hypothetical protein